MSETQKPSIGRVVHYTSYGTPGGEFDSECRAAIVTDVADKGDAVSLCVMNPTGLFFNTCAHSELEHHGGTWHWPERV